jgi:hypothetical protein
MKKDDKELGGFALAPKGGLSPWWGGLSGAGAALISTYAGKYVSPGNQWYFGLGGTILVSGSMIAFKTTRMAGYTALGTGLATLGALYLLRDSVSLAGYTTYDRDLLGLVQREQLGRAAPVKVLTGNVGLPMAEEEMSGTPPVEVLTGAGGFGTAFGTNFYRT